MERDAQGRPHFHLAIDRPGHIAHERFVELINDIWRSTRWGYEQTHILPYADEGWLRYMAKFRTKANFADSIDWENYKNSSVAV